jgi:hypothetical protein
VVAVDGLSAGSPQKQRFGRRTRPAGPSDPAKIGRLGPPLSTGPDDGREPSLSLLSTVPAMHHAGLVNNREIAGRRPSRDPAPVFPIACARLVRIREAAGITFSVALVPRRQAEIAGSVALTELVEYLLPLLDPAAAGSHKGLILPR